MNNSNGIAHWGDFAPEGLCSKKSDNSKLRQQNNPISRTFKLFYNEIKFATYIEAADAFKTSKFTAPEYMQNYNDKRWQMLKF